MPFDQTTTPLPPVRDAPVQVTVGDWFDLAANDTVDVLTHRTFRDQAVILDALGGRPEPGVSLEATARLGRSGGGSAGGEASRVEYDTTATGGFDHPVDRAPTATNSLTLAVANNSGTDYTQAAAGQDPYQFYTTYTVRKLTVLDKLRRGIPLTRQDEQLMETYDLRRRARLNTPPAEDPLYQTDLAGKSVRRQEAEVTTTGVPAGGATILDVPVRDREVVYLERLSVNGQDYAPGDGLTLTFTRGNYETFYTLETWGVPGQPTELEFHIPFFERMQLTADAQNDLAGVDIRAEYAVCDRTLQEKALYGFENQVKADDDLAADRQALYGTLRDLYQTGLPIEDAIEEFASVDAAADLARRA